MKSVKIFKSRISLKLSLYFAASFFTFAIVIGGVFTILFRNYTIRVHKEEMRTRVTSIASTFSEYIQGTNVKGGYGAYLRFIDDIAGTDVWVVDKKLNLITSGMKNGKGEGQHTYNELPANANELIHEIFMDKTEFSESFSTVLSQLTLTIGTPIKSEQGDILGVVLLHSSIEGINQAIGQGIFIVVISIVIALVVVILISIMLSNLFTKPLNIMKATALQLANGNYAIKTRIRQNDEIGELATSIDILAKRLEEASLEGEKMEQMRRDFFSNISHELKTPVTVLRGSLEALTDKVITDPVMIDEYQLQMLKETKYLQRLIGDLLELTRLQNMDFTIEKSIVFIKELLSDVIRSSIHLAKEKNVQIILRDTKELTEQSSEWYEQIQSAMPLRILGDYGRLRQMLIIILDNAIKFSPENGVIEITLSNDELCIMDQGSGIKEEELSYIFDRFYKSRSEQNKMGTGLGLSIAKQIAKRHGMSIIAKNGTKKGAVFIIGFHPI